MDEPVEEISRADMVSTERVIFLRFITKQNYHTSTCTSCNLLHLNLILLAVLKSFCIQITIWTWTTRLLVPCCFWVLQTFFTENSILLRIKVSEKVGEFCHCFFSIDILFLYMYFWSWPVNSSVTLILILCCSL